ncbi:MAG: AAA family ATPase [Lachnospiraceae bacterium]|nr:AAA family ATPase [Lachnospiraceae bacterium]
MRIKYIHIKNFKSFEDETVELNNLNILLGANASGKSNTISIFRFINNIMLYGLDDAISLLGGIDYVVNANLGKSNPIYLKFILDLGDDEWINCIDRKRDRAVWLDEIRCEFEIVPHKRGMGYKIGKEIVDIEYKQCDYNNKEELEKSEKKYVITYKRNAKKVVYSILNETLYDEEILNKGMGAEFITRIINDEANEKKELILSILDVVMPPMFNDMIRIYDFDPRLMKTSSSITSKRRLEEDGSNIANVLQKILRNRNEKAKLLNLLIDCLPFIKQIDIQNNVDKSISYRIKENYNNKAFYSNFLSDGTVNMLALIIALYFENSSGIIILEEPERNLHPQLMDKIVEMAREMSKEKQIIITTHNPELVRYADLDAILFAQRTVEGYTKINKPINSFTVKQFIKSELGIEDLFIKDLLGDE